MTEFMSRALRLGGKITPVVGVYRAVQGYPFHDIDTAATKAIKFAGIVGHQANPGTAKQQQHASGDSVIALIIIEPDSAVRVDGIEATILQLIGPKLVGQAEATTFLLEVKHDAATVLRQLHERQAELIATVAAARTEYVPRQARRMQANWYRLRQVWRSNDHGKRSAAATLPKHDKTS